jgi:two-component system NtrC family sensor kinase
MRVALKILVVLVSLVIMVLAVEAVLRSQREAALYEQDLRRDQRILGRAMREAGELTWREHGLEAAERVVEVAAAGEAEVGVRLLYDGQIRGEIESLLALPEVSAQTEEDLFQFTREDALVTVVPLVGPDGRDVALELSTPLAGARLYLAAGMRRFAVVACVLVLATSLIGIAAGRLIVGRPIEALVAQTRSLAAGNFIHSELKQRDEIAQLGRALDRTSDQLAEAREAVDREARQRIAAVEKLRQADRLATLGTLSAGVAHQLGTPLHVISGRAQRVARATDKADVESDAGIIVEQCGVVRDIVRDLLDFARPPPLERSEVDPAALLRRTVVMVEPLLGRHHAQLEFEELAAASEVRVMANVGQIQQVFTNLLVNAAQSMPEGGKIHINIEHGLANPVVVSAGGPRYTRVRVRDEGTGMEPGVLEHIFDPFFTTKEPGEGTGLGLSIAYGIVRDHGGWIEVDSAPGRGSEFSVWLPEQEQGANQEANA